ncbi:MAG: hypothetical protein AAGD10_19695 [Myxococcota bacterium]
MVARPSLDIELRPLLKALQNRVSDLEDVKRGRSDGVETYSRSGVCFLTVELKRDHMFLDLWLPEEEAKTAKSSGIAKPHPFEGDEAVRVRFERAEDLTKVSRWLELSHRFAPRRGTAA